MKKEKLEIIDSLKAVNKTEMQELQICKSDLEKILGREAEEEDMEAAELVIDLYNSGQKSAHYNSMNVKLFKYMGAISRVEPLVTALYMIRKFSIQSKTDQLLHKALDSINDESIKEATIGQKTSLIKVLHGISNQRGPTEGDPIFRFNININNTEQRKMQEKVTLDFLAGITKRQKINNMKRLNEHNG